MICVLDASVAIRMVLNEEGADFLRKLVSEADWVVVPELYTAETANAAWKYYRAGALSRDESSDLFRYCFQLPDEHASLGDLATEALDLAAQLDGTVYDMLYLVLARRRGALLITVDKKLARLARSAGVRTPSRHQ